MEFSRGLISSSGYDRPGFAGLYDDYRPRTPHVLVELLSRLAQTDRPPLVVDVGAGTGLSTRVWEATAERVVGVEPNPAMRDEAERRTEEPNVEFVLGFGHETGLPDGTADIVTCSQSLHWMEPQPTFAEAARVLRPGGIYAAYDYDLPPVVQPELDAAFDAYHARRRRAREARRIERGADRWPKSGHLERMRESGRFRFCREILLHSIEEGDADRVAGLARSIGLPYADASDDALENELRIDELEAVARRVLGDDTVPFLFGYRVRVGVR